MWLSSKESACQCRRHGFDPWSEKIPYAAEQPSPSATTTELVLEPMCLNKEKPVHCNQKVAATHHNDRKACTATNTQRSQKEINKFIKNKREKAVKKKKKKTELANIQKSWKNGSQYLYVYQ